MFQVKRVVPMVVCAALGGGCYQGIEGVDLTDEIAEMRALHNNGLQLNGLQLNGLVLNGLNLNGLNLNGLNLNGLNLNGLNLNGSSLGGWVNVDGSKIAIEGEDLLGAQFNLTVHGVDDNNKPGTVDFIIRIDDVFTDEDYSDIFYYELTLQAKGSEKWEPLCVDANDNPLPVILLRNSWDEKTGDRIDDPDVVTLACTSGVLAHCAQWGYRPWETALRCDDGKKKGKKKGKNCQEVSLADYHQACTRMARADYCGDGTPWTVPGTPIDVSDRLSPRIEAPETKWPVEAEWTPDGAYCLNDIRQQTWKAEGKYPSCPKPLAKKEKDCGELSKHRALLVSQYEPLPKKKKNKK